ncbi:HpcH/HpaI aldolase family protein [Modestobacter marinus]|uniref:HpcH/HpaI aldolase family protein n=1 Tax=Modestobacter marinus TaxID=477641 RepID=UPI001C94A30A|nr:aldolase/citrate lyase family protein [Modestobacter marinus]
MTETASIRAHLRDAALSTGAWINLDDPRVTHTIARAGFDWVCIDQQHGYAAGADGTDLVAAVRAAGTPALVRISWNRPEEIGRVLDSGADGVIVPMVETAAEARAAVAAARYAPEGRRSWGATRSPATATPPDVAAANAATACLVMVETPAAVDQVEEIAAAEGVDGIFLGPFDLSLAYGMPIEELIGDSGPESPLSRVVAACRRTGITAGAFAGTVDRAAALRAHGFTMLAVTSDDALIAQASTATAAEARDRLR